MGDRYSRIHAQACAIAPGAPRRWRPGFALTHDAVDILYLCTAFYSMILSVASPRDLETFTRPRALFLSSL